VQCDRTVQCAVAVAASPALRTAFGRCIVNASTTHPQTAKKHEREANLLRQRIEELEPLLTETQQERFALQKQGEQQRQERTELLLQVYKDVNRFLGAEVGRGAWRM
jgi:hypothetical protein